MRGLVLLLLVTRTAFADPEGGVRETALWRQDDKLTLGIDTSMRVRSDGSAAVGVGLSTRVNVGSYALALGATRWQSLAEEVDAERSWEVSLKAYRYLQLGKRVRGYAVGGVSFEQVEPANQDVSFARVGALVGVGLSWHVIDRVTAWAELTLERKHWLERPPAAAGDNEMQVMLTLGFTF